MDKVYVIYWSQSGNTETMAKLLAQGIKEEGKEAVLLTPSEVNIEVLKDVKGFAMGCPAMGAEVLEETEMEPLVAEVEKIVSGKTIGLFGSYGWGDGEWMRNWMERMQTSGAIVIGGEDAIAMCAPNDEESEKCRNLGKELAKL